MTIHSDWARILHSECPEAFKNSQRPPLSAAAQGTSTKFQRTAAKDDPSVSSQAARASHHHRYNVGVIDGHLQLMRLDVRMQTWECFIRNQFMKPIYEMYSYGCPRVVLCFDDYGNVPLYKAMTQNSRVNKVTATATTTTSTKKGASSKKKKNHEEDEDEEAQVDVLKDEKIKLIKAFGPHDPLPPVIPDEPLLYLMNRHFKLKLIDLVCQRVPQLLRMPQRDNEFILDYKKAVLYQSVVGSCPFPPLAVPLGSEMAAEVAKGVLDDLIKVVVVDHGHDSKKRKFIPSSSGEAYHTTTTSASGFQLISSPIVMADMVSLGESDIKFIRYVKKYGNALVHAIDGDYMAIALLYYSTHGIHDNNKIFIYRQFSLLSSTTTNTAKGGGEPKKKTSSEKKCWVDMQLLFTVIAQAMRQSGYTHVINARTFEPFDEKDAVFTVVFLMLCAGTDFSRNLPMIGAKRIWEHLPDIAVPAIQAIRGGGCGDHHVVNEGMFLNLVIGKMYSLIYKNHLSPCISGIQPNQQSFEAVMLGIKGSKKLSQSTKDKLPSVRRMQNTIKNLIWVTKYWTMDNGHVETPLNGEYGYARDADGNMNFVDLIPDSSTS